MNQIINVRPQIEIIYDFMASGLIHYKRICDFCDSEMVVKHSMYEPKYNYYWSCSFCQRSKRLGSGSPFSGLNISALDRSIILWIERANGTITEKLSGMLNTQPYFALIRIATAHYIASRVKPFFKMKNSVAIDETLIGRQRWGYLGTFPTLKWAWGIIDLDSRIPMIYHCKSKEHNPLVEMIKRHTLAGCVLYSDSHASYWNSGSNTSKLTKYGWYHYWICHMVRFVHEKFGFVHTASIEITWSNMKKTCLGLNCHHEPAKIEQYLDSFSFRQMFRKECTHAMIL